MTTAFHPAALWAFQSDWHVATIMQMIIWQRNMPRDPARRSGLQATLSTNKMVRMVERITPTLLLRAGKWLHRYG
jgi:hypothetical protein